MSVAGPLTGKTIVVTRPLAQAAPLAAAIEQAGGTALIFPLLDISPPDDPAAMQAGLAHLADYHIAIFISPNAVDFSLPAIFAGPGWPPGLTPAAIGPSTAKALAAQGIAPCLLPGERFDSEGLLDEADFAVDRIAGQKILILRGNGGRELLADTLRQRGAQVDCLTCYQRSAPSGDFSALSTAWANGTLSGLALSSSEALRHLVDHLNPTDRAHLARTPVFVPHARIAETARHCGLQRIIQTGAADSGLLAGLLAYNWTA